MLFGERIKQARVDKKLTQTELAEMVGITRQTISLMEAGNYNPSLKLCIDLARSLDKTLDELFWLGDKLEELMQFDHILITDVGSTTTKGLLLGKEDNKFKFISQIDYPTTVEKPEEDVKIGVINVAKALEEKTEIKLLSSAGKLKIPYLTTSSAGGGLQILVFGLSAVDTGRAAELTAYGAGGVILKTFTIDDGIPSIHKMRLIRELHPDMILMAGGIDGGNIGSVVQLAEILSLANPTPKFKQSEKIPLVFCGNVDARDFVSQVLQEKFDVHIVENIRPNLEELNTEPAKEKVHELFMNNVMERAPGYAELKKWVKRDIIPMPAGVEKILSLYSIKEQKNIVMLDVGGATTDIFSNIYGEYHRTVSANIGLSYSISNIMAETGIEKIMFHLPENFTEQDIRNYISNKMLNPTYVPAHDSEKMIEHAAGIAGIAFAWKQHQEMSFKIANIGILDRLKKRDDFDPFQETFHGQDTSKLFQLSDIDMIVGAGGILSHVRTKEEAFRILAEGMQPSGITKIAYDRSFKSPHLGVLSTLSDEGALELFQEECIVHLGYVVAPTGKLASNKTVLTVIDNNSDLSYSLKGNDVLYLPAGGNFTLNPSDKVYLFKNMREIELKTDLPILFDCRGRGENFIGKSLIKYAFPQFTYPEINFETKIHHSQFKTYEGEYNFKRELPYEGTIFVKPGDTVQAGDKIGENLFTPPKMYIIDVQRLVSYQKKLTKKEIREGILVKIGDEVNIGDRIFKIKAALGGEEFYSSYVRGRVIKIEDNGMIILREIQDYSVKPIKINVAEYFNIPPKEIKNYLAFEVGDFIQRGQSLVKLTGDRRPLPAPKTGTLKEINKQDGTITIQYDIKPIYLHAFVNGKVQNVTENLSATIVGNGKILYGLIGFGDENHGIIETVNNIKALDESQKDKVIVTFNPINEAFLKKAVEYKIAGIIAPAIDNRDWVNFYGKEIGVALTGDENIPFTLILTEGFGQMEMSSEYRQFLENVTGKHASLSGRTQIRAGVTRPMIVIGE